jgi:cytochrome oxidase Cu insertion factor (SCO1/SenC/PrrC family)
MKFLFRKIRTVFYIYAFVFVLFLVVIPGSNFAEKLLQPKIGEAAPAFNLENLQGEKLALEDLRGKFVVIHFATSW